MTQVYVFYIFTVVYVKILQNSGCQVLTGKTPAVCIIMFFKHELYKTCASRDFFFFVVVFFFCLQTFMNCSVA